MNGGECCNSSTTCTKQEELSVVANAPAARRRRVRKKNINQIPDELLNDPDLQRALKRLPWNYNFEIIKSIWKIRQAAAKVVALQFPEGLLLYACTISDIIKSFTTDTRMIILGDVTYGACCVDDLTASALGADFLIHYGHSCLVPIDVTSSNLKMLYVFVTITIDVEHLVECVKLSFTPSTKLALLGTIQFTPAITAASEQLSAYFDDIYIPQAKPLSRGEVLGCTSPVLSTKTEALVFIADGRFHLESCMIRNPSVTAYRYDPYPKVLSLEQYDTALMHSIRHSEISKAKSAKRFGVILGTLGRQGNALQLRRITTLLTECNKSFFIILLSEIFPAKLSTFKNVDAWIQIACPRLSIDWGNAFTKPLLSTYEAYVALEQVAWKETYPMDYYEKQSGPWTNYY